MDLQKGSILENKFEILQRIGAGGMGIVYKAENLVLRRIVCLKILSPAANTASAVIRFQNEAKILGKLKHSGIADVYDVGITESGLAYIALEFIDGITLQTFIESEEKLPLSQIIQIFWELADALTHAHQIGVIHRDIKPGNIMLVKTEADCFSPVLLDFGIAKYDTTDDTEQGLTAKGAIIGSPLYMSPEQCAGRAVSTKSDQYSLGCVFFELLTGEPPFRGDTALDTMQMHIEEPAPSLRLEKLGETDEQLQLASRLNHVISKMLSKEPPDRFSNMQELAVVLSSLRDDAIEVEAEKPVEEKVEYYDYKRFLNKKSIAAWSVLTIVVFFGFVATTNWKSIERESRRIDIPDVLVAEPVHTNVTATTGQVRFVDADDNFMRSLETRKDLSRVNIEHTDVTDEGLKSLFPSKFVLRDLKLTGTAVRTLKYIPELRNLYMLDIGATDVDDDALKNVVKLDNLMVLNIEDCRLLTDDCLKSIEKLKSIRQVRLARTKLSQSAVLALAKRMPYTIFDPITTTCLGTELDEKVKSLMDAGKPGEAIPILNKLIRTTTDTRGPDSPLLVLHLYKLMEAYRQIGKPAEAARCAQRALTVARASGVPQAIVIAINGKVHTLSGEKKFTECLALLQEQAKLVEAMGDTTGYSGRDNKRMIATILSASKRYAEAQQAQLECLQIDRNLLKNEELSAPERKALLISSGMSLQTLGILKLHDKNPVAAEASLSESLECFSNPQSNAELLCLEESKYYLALAKRHQGKLDECVEILRECVELSKTTKNEGVIKRNMQQLASTLQMQGKAAEAANALKQLK